MGVACLRRLGSGRATVLADKSSDTLDHVIPELDLEGYFINGHIVDISDASSVQKLVRKAASLGHIETVVHTAVIWPLDGQAAFLVYDVDLLGTTGVIDGFLEVATAGMSLVAISSVQGHRAVLPELEDHLANAPTNELLTHPAINLEHDDLEYAH